MILSQFSIHVYHKLSSPPPPYGFTTPALGVGHSPARGCESIKFSEKKEVAEAAANKIEPLLICDLFFMEGLQMKHLDHVTLVNGLSEIYQLFTLLYPEMVQQVKVPVRKRGTQTPKKCVPSAGNSFTSTIGR